MFCVLPRVLLPCGKGRSRSSAAGAVMRSRRAMLARATTSCDQAAIADRVEIFRARIPLRISTSSPPLRALSTPATPESAIEARASESKSHRARETQPAAHPLSLLSNLGEEFVPAALRAELGLIPVLPDEAESPATMGASFGHGTHSAKGLPERDAARRQHRCGWRRRPHEARRTLCFCNVATNVQERPAI
jgi:hypothetical protein